VTGDPVAVARPTSRADAELIAGYLRAAGIRAVVSANEHGEYAADALRDVRVLVRAQDAAQAVDLLRQAEHVDAADIATDIDVGLPADEEVADYLAWRRDRSEPAQPTVATVPPPQPGRIPVLPILFAVAVVVVVVLLR
jgi:hypothetical protein